MFGIVEQNGASEIQVFDTESPARSTPADLYVSVSLSVGDNTRTGFFTGGLGATGLRETLLHSGFQAGSRLREAGLLL